MDRNKSDKYITIGKIIDSHGVHGFAKIFPITDFPERFEDLDEVFLFQDKNKIKLTIENIRYAHTNLLIKFKEFTNPEQVKLYKTCLIKIPEDQILELPEDIFYIDDLKGMSAYSETGDYLGKVIEVYSTAGDVLEILTPDKKEVMVPFVRQIVTDVNEEERKITIANLSGLFDDQYELDK